MPTQLGFDPRLQLIHAEDATGALLAATMNPVRGAVNVAPNGSISLARALRLIGRPQMPIPHPLFGPAMARLGERLGAGSLYGDAIRLLRYGRGVDNSRLRTDLGYEPLYDAVSAIRTSRPRTAGRRLFPAPGVGSVLDRLAGRRDERARPDRPRSRTSGRASCAASGPPSTAASTR